MMYGDCARRGAPAFHGRLGLVAGLQRRLEPAGPELCRVLRRRAAAATPGYYFNDRLEEILAATENYTDENEYTALMKEAQKILTELDPPALYYGEVALDHGPSRGHRRLRS